MVPAGQVALMVSAPLWDASRRPSTGGLQLARLSGQTGPERACSGLVREERAAAPVFVLPPGGLCGGTSALGSRNATRRVQLRSETVREVFEIPAGGVRFRGAAFGDSRIPAGQITFDIFRGSQFEGRREACD